MTTTLETKCRQMFDDNLDTGNQIRTAQYSRLGVLFLMDQTGPSSFLSAIGNEWMAV